MSDLSMAQIVQVNGRDWYLFSVKYDTADGVFCTYIYALSSEHAYMIVDELKQTARLDAQVVDFYKD